MQETLFAILIDEQAREPEIIELNLDKQFIASIPWYNFAESGSL
jgi:hypothetical protein